MIETENIKKMRIKYFNMLIILMNYYNIDVILIVYLLMYSLCVYIHICQNYDIEWPAYL